MPTLAEDNINELHELIMGLVREHVSSWEHLLYLIC